ncbi:aldehyde dehydrogenase family protein, partial [Macrococcus caseolyticus]
GKSPAVITGSANIKVAAKRLAWAKLVNAGQTCVAPDYVLVEKSVAGEFVRELKSAIKRLYPDIGATGSEARDFGHIVSEPLFERAQNIVETSGAKEKWQWGVPNKASRFFPPTILYGDVSVDDSSMSDELFNPIFPIIELTDVVNKSHQIVKTYHDYPLALYVFSNKPEEQEKILVETRSGSVMVNDALQFGGSSVIPFGGVGHSGVGRYHGKYGFDEFTYERPVVHQPTWIEKLLTARYPPYTSRNVKSLRHLSRPGRVSFSRTGKVKSKSFFFWLVSLLVKKFGITIVVLAALYHFRWMLYI